MIYLVRQQHQPSLVMQTMNLTFITIPNMNSYQVADCHYLVRIDHRHLMRFEVDQGWEFGYSLWAIKHYWSLMNLVQWVIHHLKLFRCLGMERSYLAWERIDHQFECLIMDLSLTTSSIRLVKQIKMSLHQEQHHQIANLQFRRLLADCHQIIHHLMVYFTMYRQINLTYLF